MKLGILFEPLGDLSFQFFPTLNLLIQLFGDEIQFFILDVTQILESAGAGGQFCLSSFFSSQNFQQCCPNFGKGRVDGIPAELGQIKPSQIEQCLTLAGHEILELPIEQIEIPFLTDCDRSSLIERLLQLMINGNTGDRHESGYPP